MNATSPQGEWNSYDITFTPPVYEGEKVVAPARVTVIHNGVVVQNGEAFFGTTTQKKLARIRPSTRKRGRSGFSSTVIPMEYRNFWVRPLGLRDQGI